MWWNGRTEEEGKVRTLGNTPEVFTTLDDAAVGSGHVLSGANDRERHGLEEDARVLGRSGIVIRLDERLVDADPLGVDGVPNLRERRGVRHGRRGELSMRTYALLEEGQVVLSEGVGFGNDGDQVDASTETLHDFNIKRLQAEEKKPRHCQ